MFLNAFHDLLKPQWLATLTELKRSGGMPVSELSRKLGSSYMTVKQHCEDLTKLGYVMRSRVPRTEIGRPQIFYRLSQKAAALFPKVPPAFTLEILDQARQTFGETAPEKLLFQYFQNHEAAWRAQMAGVTTLLQKAEMFVKLREREGFFMAVIHPENGESIVLREFHNPLAEVFEKFPRALAMEQRAIETALGCHLHREVILGPGDLQSHVDFKMVDPA